MNRSYTPLVGLAKSPMLWGGVASALFYAAVHFIPIDHPYVQQYFAGHPIEYVTTTLFFAGLALLVIRLIELGDQPLRIARAGTVLGPIPTGGQPVGACESLLGRLQPALAQRPGDVLLRRLYTALEWVRRRNSAEGLDDELHYLADHDADEFHDSYALFWVVIWAIPILGFLGTVVGMTLAIANLRGEALDSIEPTTEALAVAFSTTTQSLALSIILMLAKYLTSRLETGLLGAVDRRADEELLGRFESAASGSENQVSAVRRMCQTVLDTVETLVQRQAEVWRESIQASEKRWSQMAQSAGKQLESALAGALGKQLDSHAKALGQAEQAAARQNQEHWDRVQRALSENTATTLAVQHAVNDQVAVLRQTVEATGQVAKLEETLNRNLGALAGSNHFEETVTSLAAAIQLLSARLGDTSARPGPVHLGPAKKTQAA
ncbi:MAG: MotA/TolQ/ExbB proton channel family protein [Pirellulales bacterium]|nr:MotA/TolQ/ExbB proton channel family protein [Pirellulales bacterium]